MAIAWLAAVTSIRAPMIRYAIPTLTRLAPAAVLLAVAAVGCGGEGTRGQDGDGGQSVSGGSAGRAGIGGEPTTEGGAGHAGMGGEPTTQSGAGHAGVGGEGTTEGGGGGSGTPSTHECTCDASESINALSLECAQELGLVTRFEQDLGLLVAWLGSDHLGAPYYVRIGTCSAGYRRLEYGEATEQTWQATYAPDGDLVFSRFEGYDLGFNALPTHASIECGDPSFGSSTVDIDPAPSCEYCVLGGYLGSQALPRFESAFLSAWPDVNGVEGGGGQGNSGGASGVGAAGPGSAGNPGSTPGATPDDFYYTSLNAPGCAVDELE